MESDSTRARRARAIWRDAKRSTLFETGKPRVPPKTGSKRRDIDLDVVSSRRVWDANRVEFEDDVSPEYIAAVKRYCDKMNAAHREVGLVCDHRRTVQLFFDSIVDRSSGQTIFYIVQPRTLKIPKFHVGFCVGDVVNVGSDRIMANVFELNRSKTDTKEPAWIEVAGHSFRI